MNEKNNSLLYPNADSKILSIIKKDSISGIIVININITLLAIQSFTFNNISYIAFHFVLGDFTFGDSLPDNGFAFILILIFAIA